MCAILVTQMLLINSFPNIFLDVYNSCCPIVKQTVNKRSDKPWLSKGLINACRKKNLLYRQQLGKKSQALKQRYLVYKNKLTSILRKAEKQYYTDKLNGLKGNMKETWSVINCLIGRKNKKKYTV